MKKSDREEDLNVMETGTPVIRLFKDKRKERLKIGLERDTMTICLYKISSLMSNEAKSPSMSFREEKGLKMASFDIREIKGLFDCSFIFKK